MKNKRSKVRIIKLRKSPNYSTVDSECSERKSSVSCKRQMRRGLKTNPK